MILLYLWIVNPFDYLVEKSNQRYTQKKSHDGILLEKASITAICSIWMWMNLVKDSSPVNSKIKY